jgi:replication factor A1
MLFRDRFWQTSRKDDCMKQKKPNLDEQLALLSAEHGVYPAELFQALVTAKDTGKTSCQDLTIGYRGSIENEAIFLITKDNAVVVQFRVPEELLLRKDVPFQKWMDTYQVRRELAKQNPAAPAQTQIQHLRSGMKKVNLEAQVLETPKPATVHTQYRDNALVTNAWIGDDTGKIKLCLWDEQVNCIAVGDTIQIKNATVATFKGERQVRLGKNATLCVLQSATAKSKPAA